MTGRDRITSTELRNYMTDFAAYLEIAHHIRDGVNERNSARTGMINAAIEEAVEIYDNLWARIQRLQMELEDQELNHKEEMTYHDPE